MVSYTILTGQCVTYNKIDLLEMQRIIIISDGAYNFCADSFFESRDRYIWIVYTFDTTKYQQSVHVLHNNKTQKRLFFSFCLRTISYAMNASNVPDEPLASVVRRFKNSSHTHKIDRQCPLRTMEGHIVLQLVLWSDTMTGKWKKFSYLALKRHQWPIHPHLETLWATREILMALPVFFFL